MFFALLGDFYPGRLAVKDRDKIPRITGVTFIIAAHLLEGPVASWWDTYQITHPIEEVTWNSFQEGFWAAHISSGVMALKKKEFRDLRQKYRSVSKYIDEFTNLFRYALDNIDTDAKRK
jgi:hypothetical protein